MKVTLAQLNPTVGDVNGNLQKVISTLEQFGGSTDLIVFSELFLVGYPPRDLLEKPSLIEQVQRALARLAEASSRSPGTALLVGAPLPTGRDTGKGLSDAAVLIGQGRVLFQQNKSLLPTYDVFDETRHFDPASEVLTFGWGQDSLGISICEDAWYEPGLWFRQLYPLDPIKVLAEKGATLLVNISGSPFQVGKQCVRHRLIQTHARRYGLPFVYVNQVGGNDELIFDGGSMALDAAGEVIALLPSFQEAVVTVDLAKPGRRGFTCPRNPSPKCTRLWCWVCGIICASAVLAGPWWVSPAGWIRRSPAPWRWKPWGRKTSWGC